MTAVGHVDAQLMCSAGETFRFYKRSIRKALQHAAACVRWFSLRMNCHARAIFRISSDWRNNIPRIMRYDAMHYSLIHPLYLLTCETGNKCFVSQLSLSNDEQA